MLVCIKRDIVGGTIATLPLTVPSSLAGAAGAFLITHDFEGSAKAGACCLGTSAFMYMTYAIIDISRNETLSKHDKKICCIAGATFAFSFSWMTQCSPHVQGIATIISLLAARQLMPRYLRGFFQD